MMRGKYFVVFLFLLLINYSFSSSAQYSINGSFTTTSGNNVQYSSYQGEYILIENIWTDCPACESAGHRGRMSNLVELYKDNLTFAVISMTDKDTLGDVEEFTNIHNIGYTAGLDTDNTLRTTSTPTVYLISPNGNKLQTWVGTQNDDSETYTTDDYATWINYYLDLDITNTFTNDGGSSGGSGSGSSIIGDIFGNTIFLGSFAIVMILMLYFRSVGGPE